MKENIEQKQARARKALPKIKALRNSAQHLRIGGGVPTNYQTEQSCMSLCQTFSNCGTGN